MTVFQLSLSRNPQQYITPMAKVCIVLATLMYCGMAVAQSYLNAPARPSYAVAVPVELGYVDLANGNLHLEIPIAHLAQRGKLSSDARLVYDSSIWYSNEDAYFSGNWFPTAAGTGWRLLTSAGNGSYIDVSGSRYDALSYGGGVVDTCIDWQGVQYNEWENGPWTWTGPDGTQKTFSTLTVQPDMVPGYCTSYAYPDTPTADVFADDGSGYHIFITNYTDAIVYDPNGTMVYDGYDVNRYYSAKTEDSNGNYISVDTSGNTTDTLGRQPIIKTVSGNIIYYDVLNSTGSSARSRYTVTTESVPVNSAFPAGGQYSGTITVIQSIGLPNGTSYTFTYDSGTTSGNYGLVQTMTLPTGGTVSFSYTNFQDSTNTATNHISRRITSKTSGGGTWQYIPAVTSACSSTQTTCQQTVTVQSPSGDTQVYTFSIPEDVYYDEMNNSQLAANGAWNTLTQFYNQGVSAANLLKSDAKTYAWYTTEAFTMNNGGQSTTHAQLQLLQTTIGSQTKTTEYGYDSLLMGDVTDLREWNNSYANSSSPADRHTVVSYSTAYASRNIIDLPLSIIVSDDVHGKTLAQAQFTYDGVGVTDPYTPTQATGHDYSAYGVSNNARGNLTQISKWVDTNNTWRNTAYTYDVLGNRLTETDPAGHQTSYSYVDSFGAGCTLASTFAYTTQITDALGHRRQSTYYPCSGQVQSTRDENDLVAGRAGTSYTYDSMGRTLNVVYPDTYVGGTLTYGQTTHSYTDGSASQVTTQTLIASGGPSYTTTDLLDGFGRVYEHQIVDPEGTLNVVKVDTQYDTSGRVSQRSNPYRTTGEATFGWTKYHYDGLDRIATTGGVSGLTQPDNSTINTVYSGNTVTVTDEAGHQRQYTYDAVGRLVTVWEPDPSSGVFSYETDYQYDSLDNLTRVDQKGGSGDSSQWRTRTFSYDSLSELVSAYNPESGTISYGYDNVGNVTSRTGARGTTTYGYDQLNRVTTKTYSDSTLPVSYTYDSNSVWGVAVQNPVGRLVGMDAYDTSGNNIASIISYDPMGRPLFQEQIDQRSLSAPYQQFNYTYDLYGSVQSITYPSGRRLDYAYNVAEHPVSVTDAANNIQYVSNAHYWASGNLKNMVLGATATYAGTTVSDGYNSRLQPGTMSAANPGGTIFSLSYDFHLGAGDNGNVYGITNNLDSSRSQTFTYDQLNRILTAGTASTWGNSYVYDPWSNLLQKNVTKGTSETLNVAVNGNNQIVGYCYDASGNLLNVGTCGTSSYVNDGESRLVAAAGFSYDYDAEGRRVKKASGSNGTLYWYGRNDEVLLETDLAGNVQNEYIFFNGQRVARHDLYDYVDFYVGDHLGSVRLDTDVYGDPLDDSDYYPFGGERVVLSNSSNHYKFTGKERDSETGDDYFHFRYYGSNMGRFLSPDPSNFGAIAESPQTWNAYSYVANNPLSATDPDGLDCVYVNEGKDSVAVKTGDCFSDKDNGIYVNGTVNANSFTYNSNTGTLGFNYTNDDTGNIGKGVINGVQFDQPLPPYAQAVFSQPVIGYARNTVNNYIAPPLMTFLSFAVPGALEAGGPETGLGIAGGTAGATIKVVFGHGARHLAGSGLEQAAVENAIKSQVQEIATTASTTGNWWGKVVVNGQQVYYRAYTLADGTINVGTYTVGAP